MKPSPRGGTRNRTGVQGFADPCLTTRPCRQGCRLTLPLGGKRAEDGIRTRDPHHGKVMLYQLSYNRESSAFRLTFDRKLYHSLFRAHARRLGCGQCVQSDAQGSRSASFGLLAVPTGVDIRPPGSRHANRLQCPGPTGVQDSSHVTGGLGVCMSEAQAPDRYCLRERAKGDSRGATRCRRGRIGEPRQGALWFPGRKARLAQR